MNTLKVYSVVSVDLYDSGDEVHLEHYVHGELLAGKNIVAVLSGELHVPGTCAWCDGLRRRCQSRRLA